MLAVLSIFGLLYKQGMQVSTRAPEAVDPGIGLRTPPAKFLLTPLAKFLSETCVKS